MLLPLIMQATANITMHQPNIRITFLFIMNSLPAALTLYYFFSNMTQVCQQYIIGKFVDEEKIKNKLEERRLKIKSGESSFNQKIQQIIDFKKNSK